MHSTILFMIISLEDYVMITPSIDVNECALENGGCEHKCTNRAGSYSCGCNQGFRLQTDSKSCRRPGKCVMFSCGEL